MQPTRPIHVLLTRVEQCESDKSMQVILIPRIRSRNNLTYDIDVISPEHSLDETVLVRKYFVPLPMLLQ